MVIIRGERGNRVVDSAVRMAVGVFRVLLVRQSFMWFDELGGSDSIDDCGYWGYFLFG